VLRTDTGNFNRFLTSLGLLLLAAALLIPYFYVHDTDVLRVSRDELRGLTQTGREAIERRQRRAEDLESWVLGLAGLLALGGIGSLYLGGRRLRAAQGKEDAAIERKARKEDVEIQRLSEAEVEKKRDEQAREVAEESTVDEAPRSTVPIQPAPQRAEETAIAPHAPSPSESLAQNRAAIGRIEETLRRALEGQKDESFDYISEAKLVAGSQQLRIDGLFRSRKPARPDVLLELRVNRRSRNMRVRSRQFADTALALLMRYRALTERNANVWVLIVVPEEEEELPVDERRQLEDWLNQSLVTEGVGTIISERDLPSLPGRFHELFDPE